MQYLPPPPPPCAPQPASPGIPPLTSILLVDALSFKVKTPWREGGRRRGQKAATARQRPGRAGGCRMTRLRPGFLLCVIVCGVEGELRGYLPLDPDQPVASAPDFGAQQAAVADLTQRKQELMYELASYHNMQAHPEAGQVRLGGARGASVRRMEPHWLHVWAA
eukprot:140457-Chlamydomonas_euryale.AAC.5